MRSSSWQATVVASCLTLAAACSTGARATECKNSRLAIVFDVSRSTDPSWREAWICDVDRYLREEFSNGEVRIFLIREDAGARPEPSFDVSCPPPRRPGGPGVAAKARYQERRREVIADIRRHLESLEQTANDSDIMGAVAMAREFLGSQPITGGTLRIYSDFQAIIPRNRTSAGDHVGTRRSPPSLRLDLVAGTPGAGDPRASRTRRAGEVARDNVDAWRTHLKSLLAPMDVATSWPPACASTIPSQALEQARQ
jgi:hypothetical protein